jgi:iron complex outermembrane recepter protein
VAASSFGPGASRPIIRGLGGDRVRVLENGIGSLDASFTSPDHAVSVEPYLVDRIEVIRGPATLLYGSAAIGGVVNVLDNRIPSTLPQRPLGGEIELRAGTAADERAGHAVLEGGAGSFAWRGSFSRRQTGDYEIPGFAEAGHHDDDGHEHDDEPFGVLPNSFVNTRTGTFGTSWFWQGGFAGIAATEYRSRYGIPGGHGEEGDEDYDEYDDHGDEHGHEDIFIDLRQRRIDFRAEVTQPFGIFEGAKFRAGTSRYRHFEVADDDEIETTVRNRGFEARGELLHQPIGPMQGAFGAQWLRQNLTAEGDEAFLPPSRTTGYALFAVEEIPGEVLTWQFGARAERQTIRLRDETGRGRSDNGASASAGFVWSLSEPWAIALSVARTERLPNVQELYSDGPHIATRAYEIGNETLGKERSTGLDLALRRRAGAVTGEISLFTNRFGNFIFEEATGEIDDGLPVYQYVSRRARFYGGEIETVFHLHEDRDHSFDLRLVYDWVRATDRTTDQALPRIPPARFGIGFAGRSGSLRGGLDARRSLKVERVAENETETPGYTMVNAYFSYTFGGPDGNYELFLRGSNLFNEEARPHTSFLKEVAPLPGRDLAVGARWKF